MKETERRKRRLVFWDSTSIEILKLLNGDEMLFDKGFEQIFQ